MRAEIRFFWAGKMGLKRKRERKKARENLVCLSQKSCTTLLVKDFDTNGVEI